MNIHGIVVLLLIFPSTALPITIKEFFDKGSIDKHLELNGSLLRLRKKNIHSLEGLEDIKNPENISVIDLSYNNLETVDAEILDKFINLKELWLAHNAITSTQFLRKNYLPSLKMIHLSYNNIKEFCADDFTHYATLEELWLMHNQINQISPNGGMENLRELHLNNNKIERVPLSLFSNFPLLFVLNVSYNKIVSIDATHAEIPHLEVLYLNNNIITLLPSNPFKGLSALKVLYLQNNTLTALDKHTFNGLQNLIQLYMHNNRLKELPASVFNDLENLAILYLRNNALQTITSNSFIGLKNLTSLDLANNNLTTLPSETFNQLNNNVVLYLNGNK